MEDGAKYREQVSFCSNEVSIDSTGHTSVLDNPWQGSALTTASTECPARLARATNAKDALISAHLSTLVFMML
jgi:hypothetical protein